MKRKKKTAAQKKRDLISKRNAIAKARRARKKYLKPKSKTRVVFYVPGIQGRNEQGLD